MGETSGAGRDRGFRRRRPGVRAGRDQWRGQWRRALRPEAARLDSAAISGSCGR